MRVSLFVNACLLNAAYLNNEKKKKKIGLLVGLFISLFYFFYAVFIEPSKVQCLYAFFLPLFFSY
jgi:hypothetical protein